jgi:trans-2-enoyl-CoA reductase
MKQVQFGSFGLPSQVGRCVEVPDVGEPGANEIVFDVLAFPINPADLSFMTGRYASQPPLPATPGAEGIGRVVKVGSGVKDLKPGDRIISLQRENWTQRRRIPADQAIKVRDDIALEQAAMLRINPPTALLLLQDIVDLQPGDWIVQNGANSAVGKILIGLARERGIRTVNIVRRRELVSPLLQLGADAVVIDDGHELAGKVRAAANNEPVRLAIDCVGGQATRKLVDAVCDGGTVCVYGGLAGEDSAAPTHALVFRGVTVTGFMLGRFLMRRSRAQITAIYDLLAQRIADKRINVPVEKVYPIEEIAAALKHSEDYGRDGKILVAPNGKL